MAITKRKEHSLEKRAAIVAWRRAGKSLGEISQIEKLAKSTVQTILDRYLKNSDKSLASKKRPGRPPKV
jgi:transposase